jgi:hypothetical protein
LRKKTVAIFTSFFLLLMAIGIGHHQVISFGVKTYLGGSLPKGGKITFDYQSLRWDKGKLVLHGVKVHRIGKNPFEIGMDDLKIGFDVQLFPFKFSPKLEMDRPQVVFKGGEIEKSKKKKTLYEILNKTFFQSSMKVKEGEFHFGDEVAILSYVNPEEGKEGSLHMGKKGENPSFIASFIKEGERLQFDFKFLDSDVAWIFSLGKTFIPNFDSLFAVNQGVLQGTFSLALGPPQNVKGIKYDLKLSDLVCSDEKYGLEVKLHQLSWKEHFQSKEELGDLESHPFFNKVWPYFIGDGEILGLHVAVNRPLSNEGWTACDVNGHIRFSHSKDPLMEFHGVYGGDGKETPFHLVGEGKVAEGAGWTLAFDAHIFSPEEVKGYLALTSEGNDRFTVEGEWNNFTPHQVNLAKHFVEPFHPIFQNIICHEGLFHGKGTGWIEQNKLVRLEVASLSAEEFGVVFPLEKLEWKGKSLQGKGEFDFSTPDFFDGTCWELRIEDGEVLQGEKKADHLILSLAMHDQYIKPSTLVGNYQGSRLKATFEGLYTHLNLSMDALLSAETIADILEAKHYQGFADPLALDLNLKLETASGQMNVEGALAFIREKGKDDGIEFGWTWGLEKLKRRKFKEALELGWFKGEHVSDRTLNLPLIFFNKNFRGKGEVGIEGTFNGGAIELTVDPTHISYESKEVSLEPQFKEGEKAPNCIFFYDFNEGFWRGKIPLKGVKLKEHSFGIEFDSFTSEVDLEGSEFLFQNVDATSNYVHFDAEAILDFSHDHQADLKIHTYGIQGEAPSVITFLNHFEMFRDVHFPLKGKMVSGPGEMRLHAKIGEVKELLEWKISLKLLEGCYPFSPTLSFENLAGDLYYSADEKRIVIEKVAGNLMLTAGETPRSFDLNVPLLELDAAEGILVYDCRLEAPTYEICRLVGTGKQVGEEFALSFDKEGTRLYGALIDAQTITFKEGHLNRLDIETTLSALDLVHHLDFLSASGIVPIKEEVLDEMRGPKVEGVVDLSLHYEGPKESFVFQAKSQGLTLGQMKLDHLAILGKKKEDSFHLDHFEMGLLNAQVEMKKVGTKWEIPQFQVIWKESYLKGGSASFDEVGKYLNLPIEGVRIDLEEIAMLFPHLELDWDYLKGTLFASGHLVVDGSKGLRHLAFDSQLKLIGENLGRGKLRLESAEMLNISFDPLSGLKMGEASIHFFHPSSNERWAKCQFNTLRYHGASLSSEGIRLVIPPEMVSFLGQTKSLPHLGYEEERLVVFGYPFRWDNQIEATFDFSLGKKMAAQGHLKEGYYWIGDKAWHFNHFAFDMEETHLKVDAHTTFEETPFAFQADLYFNERFRLKLEIKEQTKEGQKSSPLVVTTDWNDHEGFFIHSIEGGVGGLDFSFHHNPKDSFLDKMALAGQVKINAYRLAKFFPERVKKAIESFEIGKGYELSGDLIISKTNFEDTYFSGYLKGKHFHLLGSVMETLLSEIRIEPKGIELRHFNLSDVSGIFSMETVQISQEGQERWELHVPELSISDFRPSLLKKIGEYPTRIKPLTIRSLHCYNIRGTLGNAKSFTGKGDLNFINTFKRDYHILDIPFEILGRLGLDMGLLVPVRGDLEFVMVDGRVYLTNLKGSYSEGKRSQFFLSPIEHSYLDFEGNMNINIKMKQYVLLKVTEPFTLYIGGTFENPKYGLR